MKTNLSTSKNAGNVLMVTLIITGILGLTLASYLTMVGSQNRSVVRSQIWNASVPIAEAGIEEAMMHLNRNCLQNDINPQPVNWNADGWTTVSNGVQRSRYLGENYYTVTINTAPPYSASRPAIFSEGYVPALLSKRQPNIFFATIGVTNQTQTQTEQSQFVGRKIRVKTTKEGLIIAAMVAKDYVDFNGNGIKTDSYDSTDPAYSTAGRYDKTKAKDNGDVAVNHSLIDGSLDVANANIWGSVAVGPNGSITIGPNGSVGDSAWQLAGNLGIQPGRSRDDMNMSFPDVSAPLAGGWNPTGTGRTLTNTIITPTSTTNTSTSYPSGTGTIYTNTTATTTVSYPTSGTYIGSVVTNTVFTNTVGSPAASTYVGIVATNTISTTSTNRPSSGTYLGSIITNTTTFTTVSYPSNPFGPVTTNVTWMSQQKEYPDEDTYVGPVTKTYSPTRYSYNRLDGYTYQKLTGYTYEKVSGFNYHKITGYTVAKITSYSLVQSTFVTNLVATAYDYVLDSENYEIGNFSGNKVMVRGEATLYVTSNWNINEIEIAPGARLKLYMAAPSFSVSGTRFVNHSLDPDRLWYFGLPSNTSITLNGNGGFCGVIYAPQAHFQLNGGGSDDIDFIGASLTKSVKMNGHFHFHYDESLARKGASRGYLIKSWDEIALDQTQ